MTDAAARLGPLGCIQGPTFGGLMFAVIDVTSVMAVLFLVFLEGILFSMCGAIMNGLRGARIRSHA